MNRNLVPAKPKDYHDFTKDKIVAGILRQVTQNTGEFGSTLYTIEDETGHRKFVWGNRVMDDQLASIPLNTWVEIEFVGIKKTKKGNKTYKDYKVLYDSNSTALQSSESSDPNAVMPF
ncbi:hypothetical protein A3F62_04850 [Candidatus Woesebacteria bacterium RIFCSPHIGHO2_12_FULL_44_11]|nr:MAG: hypothetical protein A3F62_04850 [Candidatus Woesebacteria bacterium RIFCSPHIGHO2_12_FULL_44_11]